MSGKYTLIKFANFYIIVSRAEIVNGLKNGNKIFHA